jgi:cytochrome c-type biogenesis protein CcmH/NrfG
MKHDRFDTLLAALLFITALCLVALVIQALPDKTTRIDSRSLERELSAQARTALLDRLYAPVCAALQAGQLQEALLKLEEITVRYPGEAHGFILKGEIFNRLELFDKAVASFVQGVKLNGDYIDKTSQITRRAVIEKLVTAQLPRAAAAYRSSPGNPARKEHLANINYLKSRLAGGCE